MRPEDVFEVEPPAPTLADLAALVVHKNGNMLSVMDWISQHYGPWDSLSDDERRTAVRILESYPAGPRKPVAVVTLDKDGFIRVRCDVRDNDAVCATGEARWDKKLSAWRFNASAGLVTSLLQLFPQECFSKAALDLANTTETARVAKHADDADIPDHPSRTPSWKHQKKAYAVAFPLAAAGIFMQMATGKSKVVVDLVCNRGHQRVLVVCPKEALSDHVWRNQFEEHALLDNIEVIELTGKLVERVRKIREAPRDHPVVFVGEYYSVWMEPLGSALLKAGLDLVVWDEGHRLSSPGSKVSMFASKLERRVPFRLMTTGTKIRQRPENVYGMYRALDRGIFGNSYERFKEKYCVLGGYMGMEILGYKNVEDFTERLFSIAYEVKTDDVMDLPSFRSKTHSFELGAPARAAYNAIERRKVATVRGRTSRANNVLTQRMRLRQICSGYLPMDDDSTEILGAEKKATLAALFDDLETAEPVVIFYNWNREADDIRDVAAKAGRSYGELSARAADLTSWRQGLHNVLAVQYEKGAEAVSMVRSRHLVYYSLNPSMYLMTQSRFRIRRSGQDRSCLFHYLVAKESVEEEMLVEVRRLEEQAEAVEDAPLSGVAPSWHLL